MGELFKGFLSGAADTNFDYEPYSGVANLLEIPSISNTENADGFIVNGIDVKFDTDPDTKLIETIYRARRR